MSGHTNDPEELVPADVIAFRCHVVPSTVTNWQARHRSFPLPAINVGRHKLWRWGDVDEWFKSGSTPTARRWVKGQDTRA